MPRESKIDSMPPDLQKFIENRLLDRTLTYVEICDYVNSRLSNTALHITKSALTTHKKKLQYKLTHPDKIDEKDIYSAFDESGKIDTIKSHRIILAEAWRNYLDIKDKPRQESAKARYFEVIIKELENIRQLESAEKDLLTAFDEVREASEKESAFQKYDHIVGWSIPKMMDKCETREKSVDYLGRIATICLSLIQDLVGTVSYPTQKEEVKLPTRRSIPEIIREHLARLYGENSTQ